MKPLQLRQLLPAIDPVAVTGEVDVEIGDIAYDSRRVIPNSLFVAVPSVSGKNTTARNVDHAVERGAVAVITQEDIGAPGVTTVRVADARAALGDVGAEFFRHPTRELQLFAVTGTDGKTTTTYLLDGILSHLGATTGLIGTVETKIGKERRGNPERMTTPESLDLQRTFRAMVDAGVTHAVMEASSHALALQRVRGCCFAAAAVTNITADHIEFHGSWEAYFAAKATLFTRYARGRPAILNRDDAHFDRLAALIEGPTLSYGQDAAAGLRVRNIVPARDSSSFDVEYRGQSVRACIALPGAFNVWNALAASGLALQQRIPLGQIAAALRHVQGPPGRMQNVAPGSSVRVIVDYAHTPHAVRSVLCAARQALSADGRLIAVLGAAGNRDRAKRPVLARLAMDYADFFYVTNEDPCNERPEAIIDEVASGAPLEEEGNRFLREPDRGEAIRGAIRRARPGDTVVILGKGHEQSIEVNGRKEPWSDAQAATEALRSVP